MSPQRETNDENYAFYNLIGLKGEPIATSILTKLTTDNSFSTLVILSGVPGAGKSILLGQLTRELDKHSALPIEKFYVFYEKAMGMTEEELDLPRRLWTPAEYNRMSGNMLSMVLQQRENMRREAGGSVRSILFAETLSIPARDGMDRAVSTFIALETLQRQAGHFDVFYLCIPPNPAFQERANEIRIGIAGIEDPKDVKPFLESKNIEVADADDSAEWGEIIKEVILRQAMRSRMEYMSQEIAAATEQWIVRPGNNEKVHQIVTPSSISESYKNKAVYMEHILKDIFGIHPNRYVVALSPFDPNRKIYWYIRPFVIRN